MKGEIERVLAALERADVRYLVVGGVAVVFHGHLRTTRDLDLVIHLEPANLGRGLAALKELGYQPVAPVAIEAFGDEATRAQWVREKNLIVFSLWYPQRPGFQLDLFAREPFLFDEAYSRAARVQLESTMAAVVSLSDLIALKRSAGRPQDLADIAALERLREEL